MRHSSSPPRRVTSVESPLARPHALELLDVCKTQGAGPSQVVALDQVSMHSPRGKMLAIMGPSGSGKSTLLQCAAGLDRPDSGRVLLGGEDITEADDDALTRLRRQQVGFVFQSFNLMAALTAEQNVALPLRLAGHRPDPQRIQAALASVGMQDRRRHQPRELSGGQQQRVAIARAMVTEPTLLFADEPTGSLDSQAARNVLTLLRSMVDDGGQSVLMVTHDPAAAAVADSVLFLVDGRVVCQLERPGTRQIAEQLAGLES